MKASLAWQCTTSDILATQKRNTAAEPVNFVTRFIWDQLWHQEPLTKVAESPYLHDSKD